MKKVRAVLMVRDPVKDKSLDEVSERDLKRSLKVVEKNLDDYREAYLAYRHYLRKRQRILSILNRKKRAKQNR